MLQSNTGNQKVIEMATRLLDDGKPAKAAMLCKKQLSVPGANKDPELLDGYATALTAMGNLNQARKVLKKATREFPRSTDLRCRFGVTYYQEYRFDEALEHFKRALEINPDEPWVNRCIADTLLAMGDQAGAMELLESRLAKIDRCDTDLAHPLCQVYLKLRRFQDALDLIDRTLEQSELVPVIETNFHFYRGDALRGLGRHDESFGAYRRANESVGAVFDRAKHTQEVDQSIGAWTPEVVDSLPRSKRKSDHLVFIVGMFRSGTSLCEQIIASHPRAFGAGELMHIVNIVAQFKRGRAGASRALLDIAPLTAQNIENAASHYLQQVTPLAPGSDVITDKMPSNFLALGLIGQMFPDCKVVHCLRDPRDSMLSCYFNQFNADQIKFAYDLEGLGSYFADYWRIMAHWKSVLKIPILDVQYEEMVADPETQCRRLIDFVGLEWNDRCIEQHKTKRTTKTLSADQVNKPIYRDSLARWKPYEEHFQPMLRWLPAEALWSNPE